MEFAITLAMLEPTVAAGEALAVERAEKSDTAAEAIDVADDEFDGVEVGGGIGEIAIICG